MDRVAGRASDDSRIRKWCGVHQRLRKEVVTLVIDHHIFKEVKQIIASNPDAKKPSSFHPWLTRQYVASSLAGVRRITDRGRNVSLWNLLEDIKTDNQLISLERHVGMWTDLYGTEDHVLLSGRTDFERYCGKGRRWLTKSGIRRDQTRLRDATKAVEDYATKRIAHLARKAPGNVPTFGDLEHALGCLEALIIKYGILLKGSEAQPLLPTWQYDWKAIFRAPWLQEDSDEE